MNTPSTKRERTRERILDAAAEALRTSGYEGLGVADVMRAAGLTHGGFYAHFPNREALVAEALARASSGSCATMEAALAAASRRGDSPFRALVETYLSALHCERVATGCPLAALGSEMQRQGGVIDAASQRAIGNFANLVGASLAGRAGLRAVPLICAALVGGLQMARAMRDQARAGEFLAQCRDALLAQYDTPLPAA